MTEARQILHVDMDAFYASIEQHDDPSLRGRPVIVGGRSPRAVVCTASYEARPFGVKSAMPMGEAVRRCPAGVVIPPRMSRYAEVSEQVMDVLRGYSPLVEALSLDEAFIDVTASRALFGDGPEIARRMRDDIRDATGLSASAGVASSKFVAKVASDIQKPDGLTVVERGAEERFLAPLPIERMWGVGPKTAASLRRVGVTTIADLARASPEALSRAMGSSWGQTVVELARGIDPRPVVPSREAVSLGAEDTFERDLTRVEDLERAILRQAARVAARLAFKKLVCRVVTLKLKLHDHTLITRRTTLLAPAQDTVTLHRAACELLERAAPGGRGVRLTGVQASGLVRESEEQRPLFADRESERRRRLERTLLGVRSRFGDDSVVQAGALPDGVTKSALGPRSTPK
ncbi:MAG: DNA polymerase IV [Polyangiaceae bacterium]|nr:DNA polymerase IV [Polyangiaceae bacterium]MBK8940726.1 DNA polymerase IV [Polyangiaceae bacterium]